MQRRRMVICEQIDLDFAQEPLYFDRLNVAPVPIRDELVTREIVSEGFENVLISKTSHPFRFDLESKLPIHLDLHLYSTYQHSLV